jgi:hypothetical protein
MKRFHASGMSINDSPHKITPIEVEKNFGPKNHVKSFTFLTTQYYVKIREFLEQPNRMLQMVDLITYKKNFITKLYFKILLLRFLLGNNNITTYQNP